MRLNPLTTRTLASKYFGLGPKALTTVNAADIYKGVVQQLILVHDTQKYQYKPQTAYSDLLLASQGGYAADFDRAVVEAVLLNDAATWVQDYYRDYEDLVAFGDSAVSTWNLIRQLEQQLVLNATALSNVNVLRVVSEVLTLTGHVHQSMLIESVQHILTLGQSSTLRTDFLRLLEHNLSLTHSVTYVVEFMQNITAVMALSHDVAVNADFIRALSNLMLLVDDAEGVKAAATLIESVLQLMALSDSTFQVRDFNRSSTSATSLTQIIEDLWNFARTDNRTLNFTSNAVGTRVTACDKVTWNQIGSTYWPNFQACLLNNLGGTANDTFNAARISGLTGTNKWRSAILAPNGYIYAIPLSATSVRKINYTNNTSADIGSTLTGNLKWAGGAIAFTGNIYGCPWNSTSVLEILTNNDTTNTFGSITGTTKYSCAITNKNGDIFFIPFDATDVKQLIVSTYNLSSLVTGITGGDKYVGAALGSDGLKIYAVPATATKIAEIDTGVAATKNDKSTDDIGNGKWHGAVITENNVLYGIPYNSTKVLKYDIATDNKSTFGTLTGSAKWAGGAFAMNRKIYCASWNSSTYLDINTNNDAITTTNSSANSSKWVGAIVIPDGRVLFIPNDEEGIAEIVPGATNTPTLNVILSPYWNIY